MPEFQAAGILTEFERKAKEALQQIQKRRYVQEFLEDGYQKCFVIGQHSWERIV